MKPSLSKSSINIRWLFKMAWRDARASRTRLVLFMASIVLGIAAVVSIQLFRDNLQDNIKQQSKSLMGADYLIDIDKTPNKRAQTIIDSLQPTATEVNFVSMVAFPKNGGSKLVRVRGLQGKFPIYGSMETQPKQAATNYQNREGALVDATLMLQFNIMVGDSIKVGELELPIIGALKRLPGSSAVMSSVAPPVVIPYKLVEKTNLLQFGSRKEYQFYYEAETNTNLIELEQELQPLLDAENADLDTHISTSRRLGKRYENMGKFLNLVALIALLLGCVGIASSVHIYIREKLRHIAVLKCLGASREQGFLVFLFQIVGIGIVGGCIGALLGIGVQKLFPFILREFLPFEMTISITAEPIVFGIVLGLFIAVLFALLSLLNTWYVSPLAALRVSDSNGSTQPKIARFVVFGLIISFLFLFSYWLLKDVVYAATFVIGVLLTFAVLSGAAILTMTLIKRWFPKSWHYTTRQSLLNLFRPNNQTLVLIVAIGLGTFLISTLYFTKDMLLAKTELGTASKSANMIMIDIQPEQVEALANTIKKNGLGVIDNIPLVTMRIHSLKGITVDEAERDSTTQIKRWVLNHEFRTTYRDSLIASEELLKGEWTPKVSGDGTIPISISENLARDAQVKVGDTIVFNVQGVLMETVVGSIRMVDWGQLQLNFSVVFPKGVLENAPQFNVLTTNAATEASSAKMQRDVVSDFPNITVIDLRQVYSIIEDILGKVTWIINFMAFFSILTGVIVLIGSVRTSKYQRIKESVLLRTLGAKNKQILKISALEYLLLGLIGSLVGILLALISAALLAIFVFQEAFVPSPVPFVVFLPVISTLVLFIGLSNINGVLRTSPLKVLRRDG